MKKLFILALLTFNIGLAQKGNFEIGFSGGLNLASVSNPDNELNQKGDVKKGFNIGISADYFVSNHWSVKAKLIYDQKGLEGEELRRFPDPAMGIPFIDFNSNFEMDYLTLPVTVNWHFGKKVDFSVGLGGYAGFLLDSNEDEHKSTLGSSRQFSETDFGAVGIFTATYPLTNHFKIGLEYEYQHGLAELYKPNLLNGSDHFNSRHSINIGCYYSL